MSSKIVELHSKRAPRSQSSSMETLIVTLDEVSKWVIPSFQRPLRINAKVQALAAEMASEGVSIKGVLTLGKLRNDGRTYIVDGQHRIEAFKISGLKEIITDIRIIHFDTMAEMAEEFVELNTALVRMRPDDVLRGMESTSPALQRIRNECKFIGYDNLRRAATSSPVLGMSLTIRSWHGSSGETPVLSKGTALATLGEMDELSVDQLIQFLKVAYSAWGRDPEYYRLWSGLNLSITMWMWRNIVLAKGSGQQRYTHLTVTQFKNCMMALSASMDYCDWLQGRTLNDRDRNPCYQRIKALFSRRLAHDSPVKIRFPQPSWANA